MSTAFVPVRALSLLFIASLWTLPLSGAEPEKPRVVFVQGYKAKCNLQNPKQFQDKVNKALQGCELLYHADISESKRADKQEMLALMSKADIFYTNSHASESSSGLLTRDDHILQPDEVRDGLAAPNRPRLVIINGCSTTSKKDTPQAKEMLFSAFGINAETKGRAYLGWSKSVFGIQGDIFFAEFLARWTTRKANGSFPTLKESRQSMDGFDTGTALGESAVIANLDIIGDAELRYDHALGMVDKTRIVGEWQVAGVRFPEGDKLVLNSSFDASRVSLFKDGSLKIVLSAVNAANGQSAVIGSYPAEQWYLGDDKGKTVIHYSVTDAATDKSQWQSFYIAVSAGRTITFTATDGKPGDVTLKPAP